MEHSNSNKKELASIYHDFEGLGGYIECMEETVEDSELRYHLKQIKKRLEYCKSYLIETVVKDVMGAYVPTEKSSMARTDITLDEAVHLIREVEKQAEAKGMSVVTAVYNSSARPVAIHSMDDSYIASFDVAANKAYTSAALKMSTIQLKQLSQPGQSLYGIQHTNEGKIVVFGGGEPLEQKGKLIGAIGVSGGTEEEDTELARFGKNKLEEVISWQ